MQDILKEYWNSILLKYTSDTLYADELFSNIICKYSEDNRHYHNTTHIQKMLDLSLEFSTELKNIDSGH